MRLPRACAAPCLRSCSEGSTERSSPMTRTIREAVAVFDDAQALERAVFALETHGFDRSAFSLLADAATVARKLGHRYRHVAEMEDEPAAPRETFFSRVSRAEAEYGLPLGLAAVGALALAGIGGPLPVLVAAGGGAAIGAVLGRMLHRHHVQRVQEQLARGGLLWGPTRPTAGEKKRAAGIRPPNPPHAVHVHNTPLGPPAGRS